tara:strand:- start:205 stop:405 length:201 start_codon:yes stop_codon:yes gene_type:complete
MITDGTLVERLKKLQPSLVDKDFSPTVDGTIILQDDSNGKGAYIASWNHPTINRPTDDEIKAVVLE